MQQQQAVGLNLLGGLEGYNQGFKASRENALAKLADQSRALSGAALNGDQSALRQLMSVDPQAGINVSKYTNEQKAAEIQKWLPQVYAAKDPQSWAALQAKARAENHPLGDFSTRDATIAEGSTLHDMLTQENTDWTHKFQTDQEARTAKYQNATLANSQAELKLRQDEAANKAPAIGEEYDANGQSQKVYWNAGAHRYEPLGGAKAPVLPTPPPMYRWGPNGQDGKPTLVPIEGGTAAPLDPNDPENASYLSSIANNKVKPPSAGRNPQVRANLMKAVLKINPKYDETKFEARQRQADSFAAGPLGNTTRSLGVGVAHLEVLQSLGEALQNGDTQAINAVKQEWSKQFGGEAPVDFEAAKAIVADEIAKGVIGGQNAQSDREALAASVQRASSPEQLRGVITTFEKLMGGQLGGLRQQYQSVNPGATDFDERFLSPETAQILSQFSGNGNAAPSPGTFEDGYTFKGGDPADQNNWVKQ